MPCTLTMTQCWVTSIRSAARISLNRRVLRHSDVRPSTGRTVHLRPRTANPVPTQRFPRQVEDHQRSGEPRDFEPGSDLVRGGTLSTTPTDRRCRSTTCHGSPPGHTRTTGQPATSWYGLRRAWPSAYPLPQLWSRRTVATHPGTDDHEVFVAIHPGRTRRPPQVDHPGLTRRRAQQGPTRPLSSDARHTPSICATTPTPCCGTPPTLTPTA